MVSLADHETFEASTADSVNFLIRDSAPLINPCCSPDLEPPFKGVATAGVIIFQILSLLSLVALSFILPGIVGDDGRGPHDAYTILQYLHACLWAIMLLVDCYLRKQHNILTCNGYIHFYQVTKRLRRVNIYVFSAGCAVLSVTAVVMDNYCPERKACSGAPLTAVNYLQILFVIEAVAALPFLAKYLGMTINFHKNKCRPDIQHDELLLSYMQSQSLGGDLGFRDGSFLEDIVEKQADMIRYLKKYNAFLGRKILTLSVELNRCKSQPSC
ncbi:unnamed protein product [Ixodes hexagonus]